MRVSTDVVCCADYGSTYWAYLWARGVACCLQPSGEGKEGGEGLGKVEELRALVSRGSLANPREWVKVTGAGDSNRLAYMCAQHMMGDR